MNRREKVLATAVASIVGVFVLGFGIKGFFMKPLQAIDKQTAALREKLSRIETERREFFAAEDALKGITQKTFSTDLNEASARSGEMMTKQLALAGLNEADFTRLPVGPRRMRGASEIGWSIQGKGSLDRILNLVFLLQNSPYLHRMESLTLTAYEKPGEIKVRFLFLTLVIDPAPEVEPVALKPKQTLESPERLVYNGILDRDILRPYLKAPPPPAPANAPGGGGTPAAGPEAMRVVSLSEWEGQPEIHVLDPSGQRTLRFKPGDVFPDQGRIVAVDYRPMPMADGSGRRSDSRVILRVGEEMYAIERGQTLAQKRKLEPGQWPPQP